MAEEVEERKYFSWEELALLAQTLPDEDEPADRQEAARPLSDDSFLDRPDDSPGEASELLGVFRALANEMRLEILLLLWVTPAHVTDIAHELEVPRSHMSRHLTLLEKVGLVAKKRYGTGIVCTLTPRGKRLLEAVNIPPAYPQSP